MFALAIPSVVSKVLTTLSELFFLPVLATIILNLSSSAYIVLIIVVVLPMLIFKVLH